MIKQPTVFSVKIITKLEGKTRRELVDIDHQAEVTRKAIQQEPWTWIDESSWIFTKHEINEEQKKYSDFYFFLPLDLWKMLSTDQTHLEVKGQGSQQHNLWKLRFQNPVKSVEGCGGGNDYLAQWLNIKKMVI